MHFMILHYLYFSWLCLSCYFDALCMALPGRFLCVFSFSGEWTLCLVAFDLERKGLVPIHPKYGLRIGDIMIGTNKSISNKHISRI